MRSAICGLAVILVLGLSGCASPLSPEIGLFTKIRGPLAVISAEPVGANQKVGRADSHSVLALFTYGDASIEAAMRKGDISRVHHVDYEYKSSFFGLFTEYSTLVYGE